MVATMHDTMRMDTALTGILPTLEWRVTHEAYGDSRYAAVISERSLTGQLMVHRTINGGSVEQFDDHSYQLIMTRAEYLLLLPYVGKIVYFMPHYRDEADVSYREVVLFEALSPAHILDPEGTYWIALARFIDATGLTVDT
jgi:hypothetical protein